MTTATELLRDFIDIWDDGHMNEPEARTYAPGALGGVIDEIRAHLSSSESKEPAPQTSLPEEPELIKELFTAFTPPYRNLIIVVTKPELPRDKGIVLGSALL